MTRSDKWIRSAVWSAVAAAYLLGCGTAAAQSNSGANARIQAAYQDWKRLTQGEVDCIDQALQARRSSLRSVIQNGISPNDAAMAPMRHACRAQARNTNANQPRPATNTTQALASVDPEASRRNADRLAAEKAAEKALADKVAAEVAANKKAAAERAAAERLAAEKLAAEKTAEKIAAERAAAERMAAQKAAEEKTAADRISADQAAAAKAAADKAADDKAATHKSLVSAAPAEKVVAVPAKADAEHPVAEPVQPAQQEPKDERPRHHTRMPDEAANAYAAAELRNSFFYGLISGPLIFCLGGAVFMLLGRRKSVANGAAADGAGRYDRAELDNVVRTVLVELERRKGRPSGPPGSVRELRLDEPGLH